jgi:hypothetical protein
LKSQLKVMDPKEAYLRNSGDLAARDNRAAFELLAVQPFTSLVQDHPFAVEIAKGDFNTGKKLAEHVNRKAEPFYRKTSTGVGPMHKPHARSALIRVRSNINQDTLAYYEEFKSEVEALDPRTFVQLVDSDDAYKQTIVRLDDVIKSEDFDIWERCRDAYLAVIKDHTKDIEAADLHVFHPEINACRYEKKMSEALNKDYRILHPDVVALLEDDQRIEMFFRALALGFIKEGETSGTTFWQYEPPGGKAVRLAEKKSTYGNVDDIKIFYFHLINQFVVKGEDVRPGYSNSNWIDFEKLDKAIKDQHSQLTPAKVKSLYRTQITRKDGMIVQLHDAVDRERNREKDPSLRAKIGNELEDLADLAETIYRIAAEQGY